MRFDQNPCSAAVNRDKCCCERGIGFRPMPFFACCVMMLSAAFAIVSMTGCSSNSSTDIGAPATQAVALDIQGSTTKTLTSLVQDLQTGNVASASKYLSNTGRAHLPETMADWRGGAYAPLVESRDWQYTGFDRVSKGTAVLMHVAFHNTAGALYHSNVKLVQSNGQWLIDSIYPPSEGKTPVQQNGTSVIKKI